MKQLKPSAQTVLKHLQNNKSITSLECLGVYRLYEVSSRISEIKRAGFNVITRYKKDFHGKRYAEYSLGN